MSGAWVISSLSYWIGSDQLIRSCNSDVLGGEVLHIDIDVRGTSEAKHNGWRGWLLPWLSGRSLYRFSRGKIKGPDPAFLDDAARQVSETER